MTLKELISKVSFDSLLPYLKEFEKDHLDNIYAYREAYDILRNMEPNTNFHGAALVEWSGGETENDKKWICINHLDDDSWENELAKEIVVADDVHITMEELAMYCLYDITYWGFSPEDVSKTAQIWFGTPRLTNKYETALDKLKESIWKHQTPRRLRFKTPDGRRCSSIEFPIRWRDKRMNRSKRMRKHRQNKRKEYLRSMATRENIIRQLTSGKSSFERQDIEFLFSVKYGTRYDYFSVASEADTRLAYIAESMTKYQVLDLSRFDSAIVFIRYSKNYPLNTSEMDAFQQEVRKWLKYTDIQFGSEICDTDSPEVRTVLLLNKC